jgi:hypothetical protein
MSTIVFAGSYYDLNYSLPSNIGFTGLTGSSSTGTTGSSGLGITGSTGSFQPLGTNWGDTINWNSFTNNWQITSNPLALGQNSGLTGQGLNSVALGQSSGQYNQGQNAVAIGYQAGQTGQGQYAIAMGYQAGATGQSTNSIVLNASGKFLTSGNTGLFINPIRNTANTSSVLVYNNSTSEIQYNGSKTFVIDHPTDSKKYLVHACLEGPEAGIYYRGKGSIIDNISTIITLPDYVSHIGTNYNIQITPIYDGRKKEVYEVGEIYNDKYFQVYGGNGSFYWVVFAERRAIEVEPLKDNVTILGQGPYTYIQ